MIWTFPFRGKGYFWHWGAVRPGVGVHSRVRRNGHVVGRETAPVPVKASFAPSSGRIAPGERRAAWQHGGFLPPGAVAAAG